MSPSEPLLELVEPSRTQRVCWAMAIVGAGCLVGDLGFTLIRTVDLLQWWVPAALLGGVVLADLSSGLLHWAADTWGRADLPVIGPRILVPFRVHHRNPNDFLRRSFLDTNGDVAALAFMPLMVLQWIPLTSAPGQAVALAGWGFCLSGALTNQIHQWAHMPKPPRLVALLQTARVLLPRHEHARHHGRPYDGQYCITTGWCNRPLEAITFFRRLESGVTKLTGAIPRLDEQHAWKQAAATRHDVTRHG